MEQLVFPDKVAALAVSIRELPGDGRVSVMVGLGVDDEGSDQLWALRFTGQRWKIRDMAETILAAMDREDGQPIMSVMDA